MRAFSFHTQKNLTLRSWRRAAHTCLFFRRVFFTFVQCQSGYVVVRAGVSEALLKHRIHRLLGLRLGVLSGTRELKHHLKDAFETNFSITCFNCLKLGAYQPHGCQTKSFNFLKLGALQPHGCQTKIGLLTSNIILYVSLCFRRGVT